MHPPVSQPNAHAALTQVVVASASIDATDTRLEPDAAAVAGWPDDRPDHLRAQRSTNKASRNSGGRAAAGAAWRAGQVPGVAGAARFGRCELGRHCLSENDRSRFAQSRNGRSVAS